MANHKITLRTDMHSMQIHYSSVEHKSLLEALECKVPVDYQCREGYCGACRVQLKSGQVAYKEPPLAFINEGEILPCSCYPLCDIDIEI